MKDFALRLVLKQRQKRTRKWPINIVVALGVPITGFCTVGFYFLTKMLHLNARFFPL